MKKVIAWLLVLSLTAAISIGATLAYLTDTDEDVNVMTLGKVKIDQLEYERVDVESKDDKAEVQEFHDNKPLLPAVTEKDFNYTPGTSYVDWEQIGKDGYTSDIWDPAKINNEVDKMVFVKNKGDYDAYVRSIFAFEAGKYTTLAEFKQMVHLNLNETDYTWEWLTDPVTIGESTYFVATATHNKVLAPGALTEISLSQIALDKTATNADVEAFGETYQVLVKSQGIQADGFTDAGTALTEGFEEISADTLPWETDAAPKGSSVRTALHYDANGTVITSKVTNVVFGLNKAYPTIVDQYDGILVTDEQDVEVRSYYVEENDTYTVYFLSNSDIYLPRDSSRLFQDMTALTAVDTSNLNTGRTERMDYLFFRCSKLSDIDVSKFDTGRVTTLRSTFNGCASLPGIDVSQWDTFNVVEMNNFVKNCDIMESIDLSGLDVGNVQYMEYVFCNCDNLKSVNTTGWDTRHVVSTTGIFMNCYKLEEVIGTDKWQMPDNTNMDYMFQNCYPLGYLDVSEWNCSNVTTMAGMFAQCQGLKTVDGLENWDTSKVTTMFGMFNDCRSLESVEGIGNFNTGNVEDMAQMFCGCCALKELDIGNWNTGKVKSFRSMFEDGGHNTGKMQLTQLDVENWDVSSATNMACMFYGCGNLTELDLSQWDTGNVENFRHIFADCFDLKSIDFTGWNTGNVTNFDGMFNDCHSLETLDLSDFDTQNATTFAQFFEGCRSLKTVEGMNNWDTSKVTNLFEMFGANGTEMQLEYVDLSSFDTSSVVSTSSMFTGCKNLTTVYVGDGWDMSNVTSSGGMFSDCNALVGGNGTTFAGSDIKYARVDTVETPGYLTYKAA